MEFKLITELSATELSRHVSEHLAVGWSLYEDPIIRTDNGRVFYAQAIVKR